MQHLCFTAAMHSIRRAASPVDWAEAVALLHDHMEWIRTAAGIDMLASQPAFAAELDRLEQHYGDGSGALWLAHLGDVAVGTVALRCHDDATAELKRMYVRPVARRRGVAAGLVAAVLDAAAARGCRRVWLETLRGPMDPAIALYRRHGFAEIRSGGVTLALDGIVVMARDVEPAQRCA
jgi:GNAT superfamily N-acetyltransferase